VRSPGQYRRNQSGAYCITSINLVHSHEAPRKDSLPDYRPPTETQRAFVRSLAPLKSIKRRDVRELLRLHFPHHPLEPIQVVNMIDQSRRAAKDPVHNAGGDMLSLIAYLSNQKQEDDRWIVHVEVDEETNEFRRLFVMSPQMQEDTARYGDVIVNDVTLMRNQYNIPLNVWVGIDHRYKTRVLAYALHTSETAEDHKWAIDHLFAFVPPPPPFSKTKYFSNADLAVTSVLSDHNDVWHGMCLHHLSGNLAKNLGPTLGVLFELFLHEFWQVYNAISPTAFDIKWRKLLDHFPSSHDYLEKVLGPSRERWAWYSVSTQFTCGVRTTGRVESEHAVNRLLGDTKTGLCELVKRLLRRADEQVEHEQLAIRKVSRTFFRSSCSFP
jgi:hypothetical protein